MAQAQAEMDAIAAHLATSDPARHRGNGAFVQPLQDLATGGLRQPLLLLQPPSWSPEPSEKIKASAVPLASLAERAAIPTSSR
jgi:hypothetical protein